MTSLVIGLGNVDRGDDAVGIEVARRVGELAPAGVVVVETDDPSSLLEVWEGSERVVVVDAMRSNRATGSALAFDMHESALPAGNWATGGTHAIGLGTVVELARAMGMLPPHLVVVGVEVASTAPSADMTSRVADVADDAVRLVLDSLGPGDR